MKNLQEVKNFYLYEFKLFDGENDITFNIIDIDTDKMLITLAITNLGKISTLTYDLQQDKDGNLFFAYGVENSKIELDSFEKIED